MIIFSLIDILIIKFKNIEYIIRKGKIWKNE